MVVFAPLEAEPILLARGLEGHGLVEPTNQLDFGILLDDLPVGHVSQGTQRLRSAGRHHVSLARGSPARTELPPSGR